MGKRRTILYMAMVVLLVFVVCLCFAQQEQNGLPFSVSVGIGEKTESISLWEAEDGKCYVFLPSYAQLEQVQIHLHTGNPVSLNGVQLEEGMSCVAFQPEISYTLSYSAWGVTRQKTVTFLQSANVAAMHVDTQSGSMEFIHEEKGNKESGKIRVYTADGSLSVNENIISFYGRGNQTWSDYAKKPYGFVLENEANVLGLGSAQKWVLFANASDASNMRNKIAYEFADQIGMAYSPDSEWVDLYLNGEYVGLYLLCERNEIHPERINLEGTESYLVSKQTESRLIKQNYPYVCTAAKQALRIHNPIEPSAENISEITQIFQSVENSLINENWIDLTSGKKWDELIDVDSWVKMYLVDEIFCNVDAGYSSLYFYVDTSADEPIVYAGPVWDYDHSMGSSHVWHIANSNTLYANRLHVTAEFDTPWFYRLYQNEEFYQKIIELYESECLLALDTLLNSMDEYVTQIEYSIHMNNVRWSECRDVYEEVAYIKDFLTDRVSFLNDIWLNHTEYTKVTLAYGDWGFYGYFYVRKGEGLEYVPELTDTEYSMFQGWYYADTDEPFDPERPITEDIEIYAKWEDKPVKKLNQLVKLVPLGVIGMLGLTLLAADIQRKRKRGKNGTKVSP